MLSRISKILAGTLLALAAVVLVGSNATLAGGKKSDSRVKVYATSAGQDAAGKQTVVVTLIIDKGWHIYANPTKSEDVDSNKTDIKVNANQPIKPARVDIRYPTGFLYTDPDLPKLKFMVYENRIDIPVYVQRQAGDTNPLEIEVTFAACDSKNCLFPATVKRTVK